MEMENEFDEVLETPAKKRLPKKWIFIIAGILIAVIVATVLILSRPAKGPNVYTTPLDLLMEMQNARSYKTYESTQLKLTNGLYESEMKQIMKLIKNGDIYVAEDLDYYFTEDVADLEKKYGEDYKFYYEIDEEIRLEANALKDAQEDLQEEADALYDQIDALSSDELEAMADKLGIRKSDAKKFRDICLSMYEEIEDAEITDGYELKITYYVSGQALETPAELYDTTVTVYLVNGRWIMLRHLDIETISIVK